MCIIERKTYLHRDGRQETIETTKRCPRAVGSHLCRHIERRSVQQHQIVETRPSTGRTSSDGVIVTEGRDGCQRVYRDLSKRSSNSSSIRRSTTMSDRSPVSTPSSASSPFYEEVKPSAPTPPPAAPVFPFRERARTFSPLSPPEPTRIITPEGTAIYDRPPSLELPRAINNERPSTSAGERRSSVSSTQAEVDEPEETSSSRPRLRPSIRIDTSARPSRSSSSPSVESPGLSSLPRVGSLRRDSGRRDSGKEMPRRDSKKPDRNRSDSDRQRRTEQERHRRDEDERQARLERARLDASDRRQSAREELAREASRERHRQAAAAALEGQQPVNDPIQQGREAEVAQMAREQAAAAARRRESVNSERNIDDRLSRDADRARYEAARNSPIYALPRRMTGDSYNLPSSPISARSPPPITARSQPISARSPPVSARSPTTFPPPIVHQYPSVRRNSTTIHERGDEVIARARARAETGRLSGALGGMSIQDPYDKEYEFVDEEYVGEDQDRRRERERRRQFYR